MTTKEKIFEYLEFKGIGQGQFTRKCGFSDGFLRGGKHIGTDKLKIILENYPDLSFNWLVFDKTPMIIEEGNESSKGNNLDCSKPTIEKDSTPPVESKEIEILMDYVENLKKNNQVLIDVIEELKKK